MNITTQKARAAVFGAAIGDAVGVPYEFKSRTEMRAHPATDMVGRGTYSQPAGTWSDDTSMILCTLDTLDDTVNYDAVMKAFLHWKEQGAYTPYGECFDIGTTTWTALHNYKRGCEPLHCGGESERSNGNGSLMRILPAALYADAKGLSFDDAMTLAHYLSRLTHAHRRSLVGCGLFTGVALALLANPSKDAVAQGIAAACTHYRTRCDARMQHELAEHYARVTDERFFALPEEEIRSVGYVVATLECALWCLMNTDSYRDCVLKAVNFGDDTDTAACVAGALAGLMYGWEGIPEEWRKNLACPEKIDIVLSGFCQRCGIQ